VLTRSLRLQLAAALLGCAVLALPLLARAAIGLTGWSSAGFNSISNNVGFEFSTSSSIRITDLGFYDLSANGLTASHEVAIWRVSDEALMVSGTVAAGTAAPLDGIYRYVSVAPTDLPAGNYIVSVVTTGDIWLTNLVDPVMSGPLAYVSGRDAFPVESASLIYPNQAPANRFAPANFKYEIGVEGQVWGGAAWGELIWGGSLTPVPALHVVGLFALGALLVGAGAYLTRRRRPATSRGSAPSGAAGE
jgi:hypothetical protein